MNNYNYDMRNPYGSRGGYVDSRQDYYNNNYDYNNYNNYNNNINRQDYYNGRNEYDRYGGHNGIETYYGYYGATPFEMMRRRNDYYGNDFHNKKIMENEIMEYKEIIKNGIEPKYLDMLKDDKIIQKAQQMNMQLNEISPDELILTTLIMFDEYGKEMNNLSLDLYVKMAYKWLMETNSQLRGSDKLSAYINHIMFPKRNDYKRYR